MMAMRFSEISISSYHAPPGSTSGPNASIDETGCNWPSATATVKRRPRRRITRWSPCTLTMPPSSTPACWTLVTESATAASLGASEAGAARAGALWASVPLASADRRAKRPSRRLASWAQRPSRSVSSCSLAKALRVFFGAVEFDPPAAGDVTAIAARATASANRFDMFVPFVRLARWQGRVRVGRRRFHSRAVNGGGAQAGLSQGDRSGPKRRVDAPRHRVPRRGKDGRAPEDRQKPGGALLYARRGAGLQYPAPRRNDVVQLPISVDRKSTRLN